MTDSDPRASFPLDDESLWSVDGPLAVGVRPTSTEGFPDAHVALHRPSGAGAWGASRDEAVEAAVRDAARVTTPERTGTIVETDGVLGGDPRVAGSRIGVLHVVNAYDDSGSILETAASFSGPLSVDEARTALEWAAEHPDAIHRLREERARIREEIESEWERLDTVSDTGVTVYRRRDSFAVLDTDQGDP